MGTDGNPRISVLVQSASSPMTLSKKADRSDRISDLPCDVIDRILQHLNIQELVRTSILSKKWRYMWISVPRLEFKRDFFDKYDDEYHYNPDSLAHRIIKKVLLVHNGPIYKFTLFTPYWCFCPITSEKLNNWILFLSRRGIKSLELSKYDTTTFKKMPSHIFSCKELTHLQLCGFNLSVPPKCSGFKSLLDLTLESNTYEFGALQSLISCCPLLEKLSIELVQDMTSICLKNAKNLIDLRLTVNRDMVSGLIKSLPKIERLAIHSSYPKTLYADIISPSHLISLKYLNLECVNFDERGELLYIVSVLKSASNLVELVIQSYNYRSEQELDQPEELECNSCCLNQLQTVNIKVGFSFKYAMSLIQFILANSSSLKTLTFNVFYGYEKFDAPLLLRISQDLLSMKRASQKADVKFLRR